MSTVLFTCGDSNTYGLEIVPDRFKPLLARKNQAIGDFYLNPIETEEERKIIDEYRISKCWSTQLGNLINATKVINTGLSGASNDYITRTTLGWIDENFTSIKQRPENYIFVLGLTVPNRNEFLGEDKKFYINFCAHDTHPRAEIYFKNFSENSSDMNRTLRNVIAIQNTLELLNVKYLFFSCYEYADPEMNILKTSAYSNLIKKEKFVPRIMYTYLKYHFARGPRDHYLEDGHLAWAEYLRSFL